MAQTVGHCIAWIVVFVMIIAGLMVIIIFLLISIHIFLLSITVIVLIIFSSGARRDRVAVDARKIDEKLYCLSERCLWSK